MTGLAAEPGLAADSTEGAGRPVWLLGATERRLLAFLVIAFLVWAGAFIWRTSFIADGRRVFCLVDDGMVSMRYARNLAHGFGLRWNPGGEKVEGFSNPLWVGAMAGLHFLPLPPRLMSLPIQLLEMLLLAANLLAVHKLAVELGVRSSLARLAAVGWTAFYYPLDNWSLQGLEVGPLALILTHATRLALRSARSGKPSPRLVWLLGAATFLRLDAALPAAVMLAFVALSRPRSAVRTLGKSWGLLAALLLAQTACRLAYFGEWLPNTYYLKMTGFPVGLRVLRGLSSVWDFSLTLGVAEVALMILVLLFRRRDSRLLLPLAVFGGQLAYSAWVGGDVWENLGGSNRFVAVAMPLFFVAAAAALETLGESALATIRALAARMTRSAPRRLAHVAVALLAIAYLARVNASRNPAAVRESLLLTPPPMTAWKVSEFKRGRLVERLSLPSARVAVVSAGTIPYFVEREYVDMLGKSDRHLARMEARVRYWAGEGRAFVPGHLKWDYGWSIGTLRPDVVAALWWAPREAAPFLDRDYESVVQDGIEIWLRRDSTRLAARSGAP